MSIRLNKALRELNIGVQTAVEFLSKKNLGDVKADPNTKISDEQYGALVSEFKSDKDLRSQAERLIHVHTKDKSNDRTKRDNKAESILQNNRPVFKPIGKIDLDSIGKNNSNKSSAASEVKTVQETKVQSAVDRAPEVKKPEIQNPSTPNSETKPVQEPVLSQSVPVAQTPIEVVQSQQPKPEQKSVQTQVNTTQQQQPKSVPPVWSPKNTQQPKPVQQNQSQKFNPVSQQNQQKGNGQQQYGAQIRNGNHQQFQQKQSQMQPNQYQTKQQSPVQSPAPKETAPTTREEPHIFTLKSEAKLAPKVNVLGKIDLDSLNQSTRPKKKTKEERRKEREEKSHQNNTANVERKKRVRINKERVDVNAAVNQGGGNNNNRNRNNNGNNNSGNNNNNNNNNNNGNNNGGGNRRNRRRNPQIAKPLEVNEGDVAKQVKETLARLTSKNQNQNKKGAKYRKEKREAVQERMAEVRQEQRADSKIIKLTEFVTANELATMMNVPVNKVIGTCMSIGIMVSINQRLDAETINIVAEEFGFKTEYVSAEVAEAISEEEDDEEDLLSRAPIVTVMGHVDHGKTSLLDYIRKANVIAGEAGGITQHIGAYNVKLENGRHITFLDTPGHEAFTAMRARGAQVTDIAIIIIAADDSVMPTTREAIAHAQAANVPMVFAINKIDKPGANPDKIREDLSQMNLLVEEWGGKYQCQEISAKKGVGVKELLEKVLLEADMLDLKANPHRKAMGSIIESQLDKGRGYVSTVLVSNGTLKAGDVVLAGTSFGRIKAMFNERNQHIEQAGPAEPAMILGLNGAPQAGDAFHVIDTEQEAREIANKREQLQREQGLRTQTRLTLDEIGHRIALGSFKELNIIVKGDVDGSIEALGDSFIKLSTEKIKVNVIHKAVGQISESDVSLADASDAIIIGFQVRPSVAARKQAEQCGVDIRLYSVIYDAIEEVKSAMEGMLDKVKKEVITATIDVREVYHISKVGTVAGAFVTNGKAHRSDKARLVRDGIVVHTGAINALKRFKDDVKEVGVNFECGISLANFNDLQVGDIIETYTEIEVKQKL
jgi:translation initiation factor IF-2